MTLQHRTLNAPTIIGLTGPAGSGKDTVADLLRTHARFIKHAFAEMLRAEVCDAFGIEPLLLTHRPTKEEPHNALALIRCQTHAFPGLLLRSDAFRQFDGDVDAFLNLPRSPRQIMQWWGTEYRRSTDKGYWTGRVVANVNYACKNFLLSHVITDVRFENEAQAVRNMGGVIWQVKRPDLKDDNTRSGHSSEVDGSQFAPDAIINNSHDIRHLQSVVMGAWLMLETGMSAADVHRMGLAHTDMASREWAAFVPG